MGGDRRRCESHRRLIPKDADTDYRDGVMMTLLDYMMISAIAASLVLMLVLDRHL